MAYRTYSTANGFIVDANGKGDFTSISAAITALNAASKTNVDLFLHPGTYTENFTIPAGINLVGYLGDQIVPQVTIIGKVTMNTAGTSVISNIRLQTNSDFCVVNSGSVASVLYLDHCFINCLNNTGISFTSSSASSQINFRRSRGDIGVNTATLFTSSSAGTINSQYSIFNNSSSSSVASTLSAGVIDSAYSIFQIPITTTGTARFLSILSNYDMVTAGVNATALTLGGSGSNQTSIGGVSSGSAVAISISTNLTLTNSQVASSNLTHAITGAGTLTYGGVLFTSTGNIIDVVTQIPMAYPVPEGGSGLSTLTSHALQVGAGTSPVTQLATGTSGQLLSSGGASADPVWTTATFPATAGTTGTILRSNGTNWVATTSTYPNTNAINTLVYASAANVLSALATGNSGVLATSATGVPSIDTTNFAVLTTGLQLKGNNTNTPPPVGFIGEQIRSSILTASAVTLSNTITSNVTSIALTAGIWDISAIGMLTGTLTGTAFNIGITTTSATLPPSGDFGIGTPTVSTVNNDIGLSIPSFRVPLSGNSTYFLVAECNFSGGTAKSYGRISATRVG